MDNTAYRHIKTGYFGRCKHCPIELHATNKAAWGRLMVSHARCVVAGKSLYFGEGN